MSSYVPPSGSSFRVTAEMNACRGPPVAVLSSASLRRCLLFASRCRDEAQRRAPSKTAQADVAMLACRLTNVRGDEGMALSFRITIVAALNICHRPPLPRHTVTSALRLSLRRIRTALRFDFDVRLITVARDATPSICAMSLSAAVRFRRYLRLLRCW